MMSFEKGRQLGGTYTKLALILTSWFDVHIIKMGVGDSIPVHRDPSPKIGYQMNRLNILLKRPKFGGVFEITNKKGYTLEDKWDCGVTPWHIRRARVRRFVSSEEYHRVSEVFGGTRYVLSIGWLSKCKK